MDMVITKEPSAMIGINSDVESFESLECVSPFLFRNNVFDEDEYDTCTIFLSLLKASSLASTSGSWNVSWETCKCIPRSFDVLASSFLATSMHLKRCITCNKKNTRILVRLIFFNKNVTEYIY